MVGGASHRARCWEGSFNDCGRLRCTTLRRSAVPTLHPHNSLGGPRVSNRSVKLVKSEISLSQIWKSGRLKNISKYVA